MGADGAPGARGVATCVIVRTDQFSGVVSFVGADAPLATVAVSSPAASAAYVDGSARLRHRNDVLDVLAGHPEATKGPSAPRRAAVAHRSSHRYDRFMSRTIPQRALRNDNAQVIDAVVAGETLVVTRNGVAVAELRPLRSARRTFVPRAELVLLAAAGPHIDRKQFRDDLDRFVDQGL